MSNSEREELEQKYSDFIRQIKVDTPDGWEVKKFIDLDEAMNIIESREREAKKGLLNALVDADAFDDKFTYKELLSIVKLQSTKKETK